MLSISLIILKIISFIKIYLLRWAVAMHKNPTGIPFTVLHTILAREGMGTRIAGEFFVPSRHRMGEPGGECRII